MIKFFSKISRKLRLRSPFLAKKATIPNVANTRFTVEEMSLGLKIPTGDARVLKKIRNTVLNDPWCIPAEGVEMEMAQDTGEEMEVIVKFTTLNKAAAVALEKKIYTVLGSS